jgi:hypothetical protein
LEVVIVIIIMFHHHRFRQDPSALALKTRKGSASSAYNLSSVLEVEEERNKKEETAGAPVATSPTTNSLFG